MDWGWDDGLMMGAIALINQGPWQGLLTSANWTIALQPLDLAWTLGLGALAIGLSVSQGLGLTRAWGMALGRSLLQLTAVGWLLSVIWVWPSPAAVAVVLAGLWGLALLSAHQQMGQRWPGLLPWLGLALLGAGLISATPVVLVALRPQMWFDPRAWVPIFALVLAAASHGAAIAGEQMMQLARSRRPEIEQRLCLGATLTQAIAPCRREAIRSALVPTLNNLTSVGLLSLPGLLSGALLGGLNPLMAASLQVVVLFASALAVTFSAIVVAVGAERLCSDRPAQRLRD
ncbi:MAG: hypothetical protein EA001_02065 [Oscillatoriales cyanobacterium]|nr:MAG: hypothetical protein EA001_02065 [Oscillatoriales cyanobacterium]